MSEQGVSEKLVEALRTRERRLRELDPDRNGLNRDGHCTAKATAFRHAAEIVEEMFPELEADWRERLLSDEALDAAARYGWGELNFDDFTDGRKREERVHFREMFEAALAATQPHSGQPGDEE